MSKKFLIISAIIVTSLAFVVGLIFARNQSQANNSIQPTPTVMPTISACKVGGCNAELCLEADDTSGGISICLWREEYACLQQSRCELQSNGKCGWTKTTEYASCMEDFSEGK